MKTQFHAERAPWNGGISLSMMQPGDVSGRTLSVAKNVTMVDIENGMPSGPFLELSYEDAQNLMDELYHCGVRPTEGAGTAGSMKATQNHLEDMRAIVAEKLNVPLKKG